MKETPPPAGFDDIQREELSRLFGRITHLRLAFVPVLVGLVVWLLIHPVTPWRRSVLVILGVVAAALFIHEVVHHRRHGLGRRAFAVNLAFAAVGQALVAFATGGLESPFFFAMFPLAMVAAAVIAPPFLFLTVGAQVTALWLMVWAHQSDAFSHFNPEAFGGALEGRWNQTHVLWYASFGTIGLAGVTFLGRGIRHSFDGMLRRGLRAREEALRAHAERAQELSALSGEIAHELKNPLASIKGLSALLAQDAGPGKPGERLAVLRREVDRMQGILDEFLNFSRPLVPLVLEEVDVRDLAWEVAAMHEGIAHARGVPIAVRGDAKVVRCDPRKIEQALINLVQNALEASPSGQTVTIETGGDGDVCLHVLDRGPGVEEELGERIFEPGVTTKPQGSGLGLTIARALARQHGGDLRLSAREGGGTAAVLRLPRESLA
jgi:two-component system, NtrC family, sensor histidine kinase HydH